MQTIFATAVHVMSSCIYCAEISPVSMDRINTLHVIRYVNRSEVLNSLYSLRLCISAS